MTAESGPETEDHPARLNETDLIVRLFGPTPTERLVKRTRSGKVANPERHDTDALFHDQSISPFEAGAVPVRDRFHAYAITKSTSPLTTRRASWFWRIARLLGRFSPGCAFVTARASAEVTSAS
jgi:hypothetical protein